MAAQLARGGRRVVVLEKAKYIPRSEIENSESQAYDQMYVIYNMYCIYVCTDGGHFDRGN